MDLLKKIFIASLVLLIVVFFAWAVFAPKKDIGQEVEKTLNEQKDRLDLYFKGVVFQEVQNGKKYWEIKAKSSSLNKSTGTANIEEAQGTFFKEGKPVLKFISPVVLWNMGRKEILLKDPIGFDLKTEPKIHSLIRQAKNTSTFILPARALDRSEGLFFKAKELSWKLATEKIICVGNIYLKKGEVAGSAEKLEADVALEKVNISGSPCMINLINRIQTSLEAGRFIVDSVNDIVSATNGVKLMTEGFLLTARDVEYDQKRDTLYFKPSVEINYQGAKAKSDKASYNIKTEEISMTDNTELRRGGNRLTGDKVLVSLKNKTFKVFGKTKITIPEEEIK